MPTRADNGANSSTVAGSSASPAKVSSGSAEGSDSTTFSSSEPSEKEMASCCGSEDSVSSGRPGWTGSCCSTCTGSCCSAGCSAFATDSAGSSNPMRDKPSAGFLSYETPTATGMGQLRSLTFSCSRVESARNEIGPLISGAGSSGVTDSTASGSAGFATSSTFSGAMLYSPLAYKSSPSITSWASARSYKSLMVRYTFERTNASCNGASACTTASRMSDSKYVSMFIESFVALVSL